MPKFLDTRGRPTLAIAICDRCGMKFPYSELMADGDNPGLRVCRKDYDNKDPYKQEPRKTENISLRYPRPDEELK